jgi:serine/threonine protein kinase
MLRTTLKPTAGQVSTENHLDSTQALTFTLSPNMDTTALPQIGTGQSSTIHLLTPHLVLKLPRPSSTSKHLLSLRNELIVYNHLTPHPRILSLHSTFHFPDQTSPLAGLVFAYHPLGSLRIFIHATNDSGLNCGDVKVLERERTKWAKQLTEAIAWIHYKGVIHCDISSANNLITSNYDIVVCDFSSSIIDGVRVGERGRCSRWYKFLGGRGGEGKEYEERDDIWALGTVCYEMWVRKRMWGDVGEAERVEKYWRGELPNLEDAGGMGKVVGKCWVDGYADAREVLKEIEEIEREDLLELSETLTGTER